MVFKDVRDYLDKYISSTNVYSTEEIIDGIMGEKNSMNLSTSTGLPFSTKYKTKRDMFSDPAMKAMIDLQWDDWSSNHPIAFPITMASKDEVLPIEKIKKPRPFYVVDPLTTVNGKRLCDDFNQSMANVPAFCVGFSQWYGGAKNLYNRHLGKLYHREGDYKAFDANRPSWMSEMLIQLRFHYFNKNINLTPEQKSSILSKLRSLYSVLDFAEVIDFRGDYHKRKYQQPTGGPNTLHDNSLINYILNRLIQLRMVGRFFDETYSIMGDDSIISGDIKYDSDELKLQFKRLGFEYTGSGHDDSEFYQELDNITFLKMKFLKKHGRIIPLYDEERIRTILYFKKTNEGDFVSKMNAALMMSFGTPLCDHLYSRLPFLRIEKENVFSKQRLAEIVLGYESLLSCNKIVMKNNKLYQSKKYNILYKMAEGGAPNPIDPDMFQDLQQGNEAKQSVQVITSPKKSFIEKSIHPPSAVEFLGLPTNDTRTQVVPEWRNVYVSQSPKIFIGGDIITYNTPSDVAILTMNGCRTLSYVFVRYTDGRWYQDLANTHLNTLYNWVRFREDCQLYRPVYRSLTTYLNATAFNDTGMVVGSQFNPSTLWSDTVVRMAEEKPHLFKKFVLFKFETKDKDTFMDPNIKFDDEFEHLGLTQRKSYVKYWQENLSCGLYNDIKRVIGKLEINLDPQTLIQVINFGGGSRADTFVPDLSQIMQQDIRSYAGKAKEGTFTVHKLNTMSPAWLTGSNGLNGNSSLYQCYGYWIDLTDTSHFVALYELNGAGAQVINTDTMWSSDVTCSWVQYSGLTYNALTFPVQNIANILIFKWYQGIELQASLTSAWGAMTKLAPEPDMNSMQQLLRAYYELKDCMPAKYNFFGTLLKSALPIIKQVAGPALKSLMGGLDKHSDTIGDFVEKGVESYKEYRKKRPEREAVREESKKKHVEKKIAKNAKRKEKKVAEEPKSDFRRPRAQRGSKPGGKPHGAIKGLRKRAASK
jgi:hypothetical protein